MTLGEFKARMEDKNKDINTPEAEVKNVPYIECSVNSNNAFFQLLHRTIFGDIYTKYPEIIIYNEFYEEEYKKFYNMEHYAAIKNNCYNFVARMIEASHSTIASKKNEYLFYKSDDQIDYENLIYLVPPVIVEALEKNDYSYKERRKKGKQRIVEDNVSRYNNFNFEEFSSRLDEIFCNK